MWEDLGPEFTGLRWHEGKMTEAFQYWHGGAVRSTCFSPLRTAEVDSVGVPTFEEVENEEDRDACRKAYLHSLPYYLALKEKVKSQN